MNAPKRMDGLDGWTGPRVIHKMDFKLEQKLKYDGRYHNSTVCPPSLSKNLFKTAVG